MQPSDHGITRFEPLKPYAWRRHSHRSAIAMNLKFLFLACMELCCLAACFTDQSHAEIIYVHPNLGSPKKAIDNAKPGDVILISPGTYQGGTWFIGVSGSETNPISIRAADQSNPPIISGGMAGWQFSACSHLVIEDIIFDGQYDNGINIDDHDDYRKNKFDSCTNIRLARIRIRNLKGSDNNDGFKLSGVRNFVVADCTVEGWGYSGCGIDLVGCVNGEMIRCHFDGLSKGGWGIQAKGASRSIKVDRCTVSNTIHRGVQIGGVTDSESTREPNSAWECSDFVLQNSTILGADASVAVVNARDSTVRHCRLLEPRKWFLRILVENSNPKFGGCHDGFFEKNLFVCNNRYFVGPVDNNSGTTPRSFQFKSNIWYAVHDPALDMRLGLPTIDQNSLSGIPIPSAFTHDRVGFSQKHYDMLRELLLPEQASRERSTYFALFAFSFLCVVCSSLLYLKGGALNCYTSNRIHIKRTKREITSFVLLFLSLALLLTHIFASLTALSPMTDSELSTSGSVLSFGLQVPRGVRFPSIVSCTLLVLVVVCFGASLHIMLPSLTNSLAVCLSIGMILSLLVYFLKSFFLSDHPSYGLPLDLISGFFGSLFLFGFARMLSAALLRSIRQCRSHTLLDQPFWLSLGSIFLLSLCFSPLQYGTEFLYNRSRSLSFNLIPFSRCFSIIPMLPTLMFSGILGVCLSRSDAMTRWTLLSYLRRHAIFLFLIVGFETLDFFRPGAIVELDRILISYIFGAIVMGVSRQLTGKPTILQNSLVNRRHGWLTLSSQIGVFLGLVGLYMLSCWSGVQKLGFLLNLLHE